MSRRTYTALKRQAARWLRKGQSVVLDATYGQPAERAAVRQIARRCGARLVVVVCQADEAVLRARLAARAVDPTRVSDARLELWPALRAAFNQPTELADVLSVDTTLPLQQVVDQVLALVRGPVAKASWAA